MRRSTPWLGWGLALALGACGASDGMVIAETGGSPGGGHGAAGGMGGSGGSASGGMGGGTTADHAAGAGGAAGMQATAGSGGTAAGGSGGLGGTSATGGSGGQGGTPAPATCHDDDAPFEGTPLLLFEHTIISRTSGANGVFEDRCDDQGNLIEQSCETFFGCGGGNFNAGACAPSEQPTGFVIERMVDCVGQCINGACPVIPCPNVGDALTVEVLDLSAQSYALSPVDGPYEFVCTLSGCTAGSGIAAAGLTVTSFGGETRSDCLGTEPFPFEVSVSDGCSYASCVAALKEPPP